MPKQKQPAFTLNGTTITDTRSGLSAELYQDGASWEVRNFSNTGTLTESRQLAIGKRMKDWYVFTHLKKKV